MRRLIPYGRISSDEQSTYSLPQQNAANRRYIEALGDAAALETVEDDYTGTSLDRPGLAAIRRKLQAGEAEGIVVSAADRLTRVLAHSLILREEFVRNKWELHFVSHGQYEDTPEGRLMIDIEGVFAQYWLDKIRYYTSSGRRRKAQEGKFVGCGRVPYGYRYDPAIKTIVVYGPEAVVVRQIYSWYVKDRLSTLRIAALLTERGAPTPYTKLRKSDRSIFLVGHVRSILSNPIYKGEWTFGKYNRKMPKGRNDPSTWEHVSVPAVLDAGDLWMWDEAQKIKASNKEMAARNTKHFFLLRGMVWCDKCKRRFHGHFHKARGRRPEERFYQCGSWDHHVPGTPRGCDSRSLRCAWLDAEVWGGVYALLKDDATWEAGLKQAFEDMEVRRKPALERMQVIDTLLAANVADAETLVQTLEKSRTGTPVYAALSNRIDALERTYDDLVAEREQLAAVLQETISVADIDRAREAREAAARGIEAATDEQRRHILEMLETRVSVEQKRIVVTFNMALPAFEIDIGTTYSSVLNFQFVIATA